MRRIRKNSAPYKILKCLALGAGIIVIGAISPVGGAGIVKELISGYFRKKRMERTRLLNDLKSLQRRELVDFKEKEDGDIEVTITKQGQELMLRYKIDEMKLQKPAKWDKKWRLIMFDVPHHKRQARDSLRRKLKELEFYPIQKSIFITPYPCENEIDFIGAVYDIRDHILILYVSHFEGDYKLKHLFGLDKAIV